jgi:methionyl-tRNA formyltransferase
MKKKIRTIFMGTPDFAVPGLNAIINDESFEIIAVFTQPDKPVGRKQLMTPPPIKVVAQKFNIPVFQPEKIKEELGNISNLEVDLIVVIAYGKIIPQSILDLPKFNCINVHASLLPKYRGSACLNAPIINGDEKTGITIMRMDAGMDTGPILFQKELILNGNETLEIVHDKLSLLGAESLPVILKDWIEGKIKEQKQDEARATYVKKLEKEDGRIDWEKTAIEIERQIRGLNPWPGTYTIINEGTEIKNKTIKILKVDNNILKSNEHKIGEVFLHNNELAIQSRQDSLLILNLQIEGGKVLESKDFLRGNKNIVGCILN